MVNQIKRQKDRNQVHATQLEPIEEA